ncbi:MAG: DUF721 domain-containing protein [Rhodanobacter sp.]|nr:MAG: DUF721 domain-containing protein [Rhodanobacter sp.]TAM15057.1 MAG: DUF721 domain-containing protein [Rhodanobacter sp.]TAM36473.1 MAG: DUF721 domain-containing protein [Rhodanobacter sp.]
MSRARSPASGPRALGACGAFASLARRSATLDALDRALRQTLPLPLRDEVRFANRRGTRLVFLASSPAWATRLRLMQGSIFAAAHSLDVAADTLIVKVTPLPRITLEAPPARILSDRAAAHLRAVAATASDPEWRALYDRLAATATPSDTPKR